MTNERHETFVEANGIMDRLGPSKLQPDEERLLRDCAEGLLLCSRPDGEEAEVYRRRAAKQIDALVESGRWMDHTASMLREAIEGCCPVPVAA